MAVSDQTRSGDLAETFKSERETTKNQIRVALPGIIQSFDPDAVTAVVQPATYPPVAKCCVAINNPI